MQLISYPDNMSFHPHMDIFATGCDALINPVNVDVRIALAKKAAGLAGAFRTKYPQNFENYSQAVIDQKFILGTVWICKEKDQVIINLPTKGTDVRQPARVEFIEDAMNDLHMRMKKLPISIKTIAVPRLGGGLGKLDFDTDVLPIVTRYAREHADIKYHILSHRP